MIADSTMEGELSYSQHETCSNYSCISGEEIVSEPLPARESFFPRHSENALVWSTDALFAMFKRELHADMQEFEKQLRQEVRREVAREFARLERECIHSRPVSTHAPVAKASDSSVGQAGETLHKAVTVSTQSFSESSLDMAECLQRNSPKNRSPQGKKHNFAASVQSDSAHVDAEQHSRQIPEASQQSNITTLTPIHEATIRKFNMRSRYTTNSRSLIRGSLFNVQHRAYDAMKDLESHAGIPARILRCIHFSAVGLLVLMMIAFVCWGLLKVAQRAKYSEIRREERGWGSDSMPLPRIAYNVMNNNFSAKLKWCSILHGNISTKQCVERQAHPCKMGGWHRGMMCFPSDLHVTGTFGDPIYEYTKLHIFLNQTASAAIGDVDVEVAWEQHITLFTKLNMQQLYTGTLGLAVSHECFFHKILSIVGLPVGFAGRHGNDESEQLLYSKKVLSKAHEYTRLSRSPNPNDVLSVYFRASLVQREDFYEPYSILRLLEASGGLWTSLKTVISAFTLTSALAYLKIANCFKHEK